MQDTIVSLSSSNGTPSQSNHRRAIVGFISLWYSMRLFMLSSSFVVYSLLGSHTENHILSPIVGQHCDFANLVAICSVDVPMLGTLCACAKTA